MDHGNDLANDVSIFLRLTTSQNPVVADHLPLKRLFVVPVSSLNFLHPGTGSAVKLNMSMSATGHVSTTFHRRLPIFHFEACFISWKLVPYPILKHMDDHGRSTGNSISTW